MKLTDMKVRKTEPEPGKRIKLHDEGGLYLEVPPSGKKVWRLRIRRKGGDTVATLGRYPAMGVAEARAERDRIRLGAPEKKNEREYASPTFESVAMEWHQRNAKRWSESHRSRVLRTLENELFPIIGKIMIADISAPQVMGILKSIEKRGHYDHAHDMRQRLNGVFQYAEAAGYREGNPAAAMKHVLMPLPASKPRPAVMTIEDARLVLKTCENIPAFPWIRIAMRMLALTSVRPGEIRFAQWQEFEDLDGENPTWKIPAMRMKMKRDHWVPLTRQAVEAIKAVKTITGDQKYCFPHNSGCGFPISQDTLGALLDRAGWAGKHVPHGWRATFSTIMNERRKADRGIIDLMLAHISKDKVEAAYNRSMHFEARRDIAQEWSDLLMDGLSDANSLLDLPRRSLPNRACS